MRLSPYFPAGLPGRLNELVDPALCDALAVDFKANPVLRVGGGVRLAYADIGEPKAWLDRVCALWGAPRDWLLRYDCRRMIDSDGSERAILYLDDLQDAGRPDLICETLELPSGRRGQIERLQTPPTCPLTALGATGQWGLRDDGSLLWVTESRWRDNADETRTIVRRLAESDPFAGVPGSYPDAVELCADGSVDITVGFL